MTKFVNESGGMLVLADQRSIPAGSEIEIDAESQKNVAVSRWIEEGKLVEQKASKSTSKSDDK